MINKTQTLCFRWLLDPVVDNIISILAQVQQWSYKSQKHLCEQKRNKADAIQNRAWVKKNESVKAAFRTANTPINQCNGTNINHESL